MTFVDGFAERDFVGYLVSQLGLENDSRPACNEWCRVGNTVGALALRLNLLSQAQVDTILEMQETQGGYFGELAYRAGYLDPAQISRLLELQDLHDQLFPAEQLVVAGIVDIPTLVGKLSSFLSESVACEP